MIKIVYESMLKYYCKKLIGKPYIWGGNGGEGFDCSGFVIEVLQATGYLPIGDWTSQGLLERFSKLGWEKVSKDEIKGLEVCFWGKEKATHCSVAIDERFMVEAGGGGSKCTSASNTTGMVRIRPLVWRKDFLAAYRLPIVPPFAPQPPLTPSV